MKITPLLSLLALLAAPLASRGQITTIFKDNFNTGSTLNPTAASGTATPTMNGTTYFNRTAYCIASTKGATSTATNSAGLRFSGLSSTSGYVEAQALFTTTPVTLTTPGQYIEIYCTVTGTTNLFNYFTGTATNNEQIDLGLYNSSGSAPTNGTLLWNSGIGTSLTATNGGTKGWVGFDDVLAFNSTNTTSPLYGSVVYNRASQLNFPDGTNNCCTVLGNTGGSAPNSGAAITNILTTIGGAVAQPTFTNGSQYTLDFRIYYVSATQLAMTNTLYFGAGNSGAVYSSATYLAQGGGLVSGAAALTNAFDGLCIGFRAVEPVATAEFLQLNGVTVLSVTPSAPSITGLTNETVLQGTSPTLSPTIAGAPAPALQWYVSTDGGVTSNALTWATGASLTLTNVQYSQNNDIYFLLATNSQGMIESNMTLSVLVPPTITGLNNQAANIGDTITISPTVGGEPTPVYQWQYDGTNLTDGVDANGSTLTGSATSTLVITGAQVADSGTYSLIASNSAGMVTNSMALTVAPGNVGPTLTGPTNITVLQNNNATFSASAAGVPNPTLQWLDQTGTPITGATNTTLVLTNVQYAQNGFVYSVVATNVVGSITNSATLTVVVAPEITLEPSSAVVTNTQSVSFTVAATAAPAPAYQWYKNSTPISLANNSSANSATLTIASVAPSDTATYSVVITNLYGSTNSTAATLTVNSLMSTTAFNPANGATGICYDTPLYVTFGSTPSLGSAGKISIYNVTNTTTPVDTLDLSLNVTMAGNAIKVQPRTIAGDTFTNFPVIITGKTAAIYPHLDVLTSNQTYYVTIDDGVFADATGAYFAGIAANTWTFTTKPGGPANVTNLLVAQDDSGDFATVQGALDSVPANNTTLTYITVNNGLYTEIVDFKKGNLVLRGQSRSGTIIGYANNSYMNGSTHSRMAMKVNANSIALDNLTITNATPQDLSQAEALMVESGAAQIIVNHCNVDSYQDTILANISTSKAYFNDSLIQGDVDFIWGGGNLFFTNCEIRYEIRPNNSAALGPNPSPNVNTDISSNGFSFVSCRFTTLPGANPNDVIGRTRSITNGNTALIGCMISTNIGGWYSDAVQTNEFRNWYYACTNDLGTTVTLSNGIALSPSDPEVALASSATTWLYGWVPALSPNLISQPVGQTTSAGQPITLTVGATGIPSPAYQWFQNGTNLPNATSATLSIASAQRGNGGNYYVVASNASGSVTSAVVTVTYQNTAPVAGPSFTFGALLGVPTTVQIVGGQYSPTDVDGDVLTITTVTGETNGVATTDGSNVTYTATSGPSDTFTYTVSDGYGGTASTSVMVQISTNVMGYNQLSLASPAYGTNVLAFAGIPTDLYALEMTTNLVAPIVWTPIATNPAANDGSLIFTNLGTLPSGFFRTRLVP